jgi:hypothetical protein
MVISPLSSVRQARTALAAGWHESKCSRIEHVRAVPSEADIRLWCQVCGAEGSGGRPDRFVPRG